MRAVSALLLSLLATAALSCGNDATSPPATPMLVFDVAPTSAGAGVAFDPVVRVAVQDGNRHIIAGATTSITVAIGTNPSGGTLGGTATRPAVGGVATFPGLSIDKLGSGYTLTAAGSGLIGATSAAFDVHAGPAARLAFAVQPTSVTPGAAISPPVQVTVLDALGNTVTSASTSVTVAFGANPSGGTLGGTTTIAAVAGVATFANLSIDRGGVGYTLTAAAAALAGDTSDSFNAGYHPAGTVLAALPLSGRPHGVAVAANGVFYISRIDDDSVTRGQVDSVTQAFTGSAPVGSTPAHVCLTPDGTTAFTANQYGNSVSVVDVLTNTHTRDVPLTDGGFNLLASPDGQRLYVTTAAGILHVFSIPALQRLDTLSVGAAANGLAIDPHGQRVYVSSIFANRVSAIDAATDHVLRAYAVAGEPQRIALHSSGDELYVASQSVGLEVLDLASGVHTAVPGLAAGGVGLALSPDEKVLYVTNPPAGTVDIVDRATRQVVGTLTGLASPRNVAFAAGGRVAIITGEGGFVYFVR